MVSVTTHYPGSRVIGQDPAGVEYGFVLTDSFDGVIIDYVEATYVESLGTRFTVYFDEASLRQWRRLGVDVESPVITSDPTELTASDR